MLFMGECKVFLCLQPTDMRKSYEGLSFLVHALLQQDPLSGHVFVFTNKKKDRLKILYWHLNGLSIWQKRLEKGQFFLPVSTSQKSFSMTLSLYQLSGLFQGINWQSIPQARLLSYKMP